MLRSCQTQATGDLQRRQITSCCSTLRFFDEFPVVPPDPSLTFLSIALIVLVAAPAGLIAGMLPGVGGKTALAVATPLLIGYDPLLATLFLMALHFVVRIGGALPASVLGVPGSSADAALIVHGYALTRAGQPHRAVNAAASAGVAGGLVGLAGFAMAVELGGDWMLGWQESSKLYAYLLAFCVIVITEKKGLVPAVITLAVGCGLSLVTAPLIDQREISILALMMGLLVVPELLLPDDPTPMPKTTHDTSHEGTMSSVHPERATDAQDRAPSWFEIAEHKRLTLVAATGGWLVGLVPGIGSTSLSWMALTLLGKTETQKQGDVRGVIAPVAATTAKDGGSLSTTLLLGIPGSSSMLLLVGAMMTYNQGDSAGLIARIIREIDGVTVILALTLMIAGVLAPWVGRLLAKAHGLPRGALLKGTLVLVLLSVWLTLPTVLNIVALCIASVLGWGLRRLKLPGVPLVLGLILGADALTLLLPE